MQYLWAVQWHIESEVVGSRASDGAESRVAEGVESRAAAVVDNQIAAAVGGQGFIRSIGEHSPRAGGGLSFRRDLVQWFLQHVGVLQPCRWSIAAVPWGLQQVLQLQTCHEGVVRVQAQACGVGAVACVLLLFGACDNTQDCRVVCGLTAVLGVVAVSWGLQHVGILQRCRENSNRFGYWSSVVGEPF